MAKTLLSGQQTHQDKTIYTCPSSSYAKVTVLYISDKNNDGYIYELGNNGSARYAKLRVNGAIIVGGAYPYSGVARASSGSTVNAGGMSSFDGNLIVPPSAILSVGASYNRTVVYALLIEEISKSIVEA
jgi:hypothetical protein